ncbi:unnamed protein product [Rotaria sordida]|uniref:Uncharacterized protein n=1 Tax=Rotaria sordida TaxID=392033 RepID=A0A815US22_9BILA|nr:unnamed protein product [Rotaria sordida]
MTDQYKFYLNQLRQSPLSQSIFTAKQLFYIKTCSFFLGVYLFVKGPDFSYLSEELIHHFDIDYVQIILLHTYTIESWTRNYVRTDQYKFYLNQLRQSPLSPSIFTAKQ